MAEAHRVTLFAGPSACGVPRARLLRPGERWRPPVGRGDIDRLVQAEAPAVIVVCDGVFGAQPAVSHAELCRAIAAGWSVWGVASLGAIRAYELRDEGMHGFGWVRGLFDRLPDLADDELCLLHAPQRPWFPLSEALVNLRYALACRGRALGIGAAAQQRLIDALRACWFGERTEARVRTALLDAARVDAPTADALIAWLRAHPIKTLDLVALMAQRPWEAMLRAQPCVSAIASASTSTCESSAPARISSASRSGPSAARSRAAVSAIASASAGSACSSRSARTRSP